MRNSVGGAQRRKTSGEEGKSVPKGLALSLSNCRIFFDFDNTITPFDVLDKIIERFSINDKWRALEEAWVSGKISSRQCLEGQLQGVRVTRKILSKYLSSIRVDRHFKKILSMCRKKGIETTIVSDGFSFIIESILRNNGIRGVKVYSNRLKFYKDRLISLFPYENPSCVRCANCKTMHLFNNGSRNRMIIYVGDGLSDVCPAQQADVVFAKDSLLAHLKTTRSPWRAFSNLRDVYNHLKEARHGTKAEN